MWRPASNARAQHPTPASWASVLRGYFTGLLLCSWQRLSERAYNVSWFPSHFVVTSASRFCYQLADQSIYSLFTLLSYQSYTNNNSVLSREIAASERCHLKGIVFCRALHAESNLTAIQIIAGSMKFVHFVESKQQRLLGARSCFGLLWPDLY